MKKMTSESFFKPSRQWTRNLERKVREKTSLPHLQKEVSLHIWNMLETLARHKRHESTARYPIVNGKEFDSYIKEKLRELLPPASQRLIGRLAVEFVEWIQSNNGSVSFPTDHPIELLRAEKHGVDIILHPPLLNL